MCLEVFYENNVDGKNSAEQRDVPDAGYPATGGCGPGLWLPRETRFQANLSSHLAN